MDISHLTRVLPVPDIVHESVSYDQWDVYETITGIVLPADYKAFLYIYGTGIIGSIISPYNPFSRQREGVSYYPCTTWMQELIGITKLQFTGDGDRAAFPYDLYPTVGGVFPWGHTDNGDELYWLTSGNPDTWTVVINQSHSSTFEHHVCTMTAFLAGFITGALQSEILGPRDALDWDDLFSYQ